MLATVIDLLRCISWQLSSEESARPEPIMRPGAVRAEREKRERAARAARIIQETTWEEV